jgi:hypothetical protein
MAHFDNGPNPVSGRMGMISRRDFLIYPNNIARIIVPFPPRLDLGQQPDMKLRPLSPLRGA